MERLFTHFNDFSHIFELRFRALKKKRIMSLSKKKKKWNSISFMFTVDRQFHEFLGLEKFEHGPFLKTTLMYSEILSLIEQSKLRY